ncbi:MAG: hypothetical protein WAM66_05975 [Acidobacteriaceae bacterium]
MSVTNPQATVDRRVTKTIIFIAIAVIANSFGNLMLALGMGRMPDFAQVGIPSYLLHLLASPFVLPGALVTAVFTFAQLSLFSWADLSFVVPCVASSYILTTVLGEFVLGEHIHAQRWLGVLLICAGVALVAETPESTKDELPRESLP